ncbi:MAG: 23S rRNA (uracil(1939)-C(5))-methyltransferase RlmD [Parachlamydiaceae bacterium]
MKKLNIDDTLETTIHAFGKNGEGIGGDPGYPIYVNGALPEERVLVRLSEVHHTYARALLLKILHPSPKRVTPPCDHFLKCGGCQLMHLSYEDQLIYKQEKVKHAFENHSSTPLTIQPCIPSPSPSHYRNKTQYPIATTEEKISLGLYEYSSHRLIPIKACHIHSFLGESVYQQILKLLQDSSPIPLGLKYLLIRTSETTQEALVTFVTASHVTLNLHAFAENLMKQHPNVKGVVRNINNQSSNVILGSQYETLAGVSFISEKLNDLFFKISSASFFQVNPRQAERLYQKALDLSEVTGGETIVDAFCGVGAIALFFAKHVTQVIGIERVSQAIDDANENARLNHVSNACFVCAPAEEYLQTLSHVDLLILNPPRKGCDPKLLHQAGLLKPKIILYISCDPNSLARDIAILNNLGYRTEVIQPLDMFPQTIHVETIVKLVLG